MKVLKSIIFLVKSFLDNIYRHLVIFSGHTELTMQVIYYRNLGSMERACSSSCGNIPLRGAAIAQWIRLRLPSRRPGFESQAHHLRFFHL